MLKRKVIVIVNIKKFLKPEENLLSKAESFYRYAAIIGNESSTLVNHKKRLLYANSALKQVANPIIIFPGEDMIIDFNSNIDWHLNIPGRQIQHNQFDFECIDS